MATTPPPKEHPVGQDFTPPLFPDESTPTPSPLTPPLSSADATPISGSSHPSHDARPTPVGPAPNDSPLDSDKSEPGQTESFVSDDHDKKSEAEEEEGQSQEPSLSSTPMCTTSNRPAKSSRHSTEPSGYRSGPIRFTWSDKARRGGRGTGAGANLSGQTKLAFSARPDSKGSRPHTSKSHTSPSHAHTSPAHTNRPNLPPSLGAPLDKICFGPSAYPVLPLLKTSPTHSVLFRPRITPGHPPLPFPNAFRDIWDEHHVRMPCSASSLYPVATPGSPSKTLRRRWDLIGDTLRRPIANSYDFEEAVKEYNSVFAGRWDFSGLHTYFTEVCTQEESEAFFKSVLPRVVSLALSLPQTVTHAVPLLSKQRSFSVSFTQQQVACLLANAFLCTFPQRNAQRGGRSAYSSYPMINFSGLFRGSAYRSDQMVAKLKCILHYFKRVTSEMPDGVVTFTRQVRGGFG